MATGWLEATPGLVWLVECGVGHLQPVNVSNHYNACNDSPSVSFTAVDCGSLDAPSNGAVSTSSGTTFNRVATYTCITGYMISGTTNTRTCQATGSWNPAPPTCASEYHR